MSSSNQGRNSGLRFLWIPGRKRHDRKGQYTVTKNYQNPYKASGASGGPGSQRRNEPWAMGGLRGHRGLIGSDELAGNAGGELLTNAATSSATTSLLTDGALAVAGGAVAAGTVTEAVAEEKNKKEGEEEVKSELSKENVDAANEACEPMLNDKKYHNASTLVLGEKGKKSNGSDDLDSIEYIDESKTDLNEDEEEEIDVTDTASTHNLHSSKQRRRNRKNKKKNKNKSKDKEDTPPDEKLVSCLYYSLACCDCTIS